MNCKLVLLIIKLLEHALKIEPCQTECYANKINKKFNIIKIGVLVFVLEPSLQRLQVVVMNH